MIKMVKNDSTYPFAQFERLIFDGLSTYHTTGVKGSKFRKFLTFFVNLHRQFSEGGMGGWVDEGDGDGWGNK